MKTTIRVLRKKLRLSQADFGKLLGTTPGAVYLWEKTLGALNLRDKVVSREGIPNLKQGKGLKPKPQGHEGLDQLLKSKATGHLSGQATTYRKRLFQEALGNNRLTKQIVNAKIHTPLTNGGDKKSVAVLTAAFRSAYFPLEKFADCESHSTLAGFAVFSSDF